MSLHQARWRGLLASGWVQYLAQPDSSPPIQCALPGAWPQRGIKKPVSQRKLSFWGCTERGGVKRLVVSAASAMSFAWVSVSYYTNAKLVKKDLLYSFKLLFFSLSLSSYFHIWLTKTICKELGECPSHNAPLCGEVTSVLVIQLNETAEHDSSRINNLFK